jgi:hypothetical protein
VHIMHSELVLCRAALFWAIATTAIFRFPTSASAIRAPAALPSSAPMHRPVACAVTTDQVRFDRPLPRIGRLLASGKPIKIVALGSSFTYGEVPQLPLIRAASRRNLPTISGDMKSRWEPGRQQRGRCRG